MHLQGDERAVSPTIATALMLLVVIVVSSTTFVLVNEFRDRATEPAPHIALATDPSASTTNQWRLTLQSAVPPRPVDQFLVILRTPQNGTLVADISSFPVSDQMEFFWRIGADETSERHAASDTPGDPGVGGYHLRFTDIDSDGRLGGGDRLHFWYDGDGDHGHVSSADDPWPSGTYTFELKHQRSDRFTGYDTRQF